MFMNKLESYYSIYFYNYAFIDEQNSENKIIWLNNLCKADYTLMDGQLALWQRVK